MEEESDIGLGFGSGTPLLNSGPLNYSLDTLLSAAKQNKEILALIG